MPDSAKQQRSTEEKSDSLSISIGRRLVEARMGLGLSQQAVHTRTKLNDPEGVGVSRAVLSLYETGVNKPGAREIRILCETLKVTPNWLLYGTDSPAKTLQPSLEFLRGSEVTLSVRLAYALLALSPEEREAIASLIFILASKKLNDVQLSSLMTMASLSANNLNKEILEVVGDDANKLPLVEVIEKFVSSMSDAIYTNIGTTRPSIPEDEIDDFDPENPPPSRKFPPKT